jgi:2'-5' RNA ligase
MTKFEIVPHPLRGTKDAASERIVLMAAEIRAAQGSSDERPIIEIVSTSTGEDRHGSTILEWDDATFMRTGHVLWQHDIVPALPYVGKKLAHTQVGNKSVSTIELLVSAWRHIEAAHGNLPRFLWEAFQVHGMGAISRAFIPREWKPRKATTIPTEFAENIEYTRVEQTEESFVNVPSNRDAFARAMDRARTAGRFNDQLARVLGFEVAPIIVTTAKEPAMPTRTAESFRSSLATVLKRCCGCEPYREPKPETITEEQKVAEIASMSALAASMLSLLDVALTGWRSTKENLMRGVYSGVAIDCMYRVEGLIWRARDWYGEDLALELPAYSDDDLTGIASAAAPEQVARTIRTARRAGLQKDQRVAVRAKIAELVRCCGCFPCEDETPVLPTDEVKRAEEIELLREVAEHSMTQVELGMRGWTTAETEPLLHFFNGMLVDGMYRFDRAVRHLAEWYGQEIEAVPDVEPAEVERAFAGHQHVRAGAVFSKKNLDKIDQIITIATELRAAANKPTPEDVPADEERAARETFERWCARMANEDAATFAARMARVAEALARMAGPFEFASTQVNLGGDVAEQVLALAATIPDEALAEKGRETQPHVTVKFGIDGLVKPEEVFEVIENSDSAKEMAMRGGVLTLGVTAIFEADEHDVVYVAVESEDLVLLNKIISERLAVTDTHPEYIPHVTLAYMKKGEGQKYAGAETLVGTSVTFDAIVFSDVDGNETEIPLAGEGAPAATEDRSTVRIRIKTGGPSREQGGASQKIRVLVPDTPRDRRGDDPSSGRSGYLRLLSD